ncbi:hypothetical protein A3K86_00255 [Photobacterium jeanii]|uniref:Opacity-associated protein A LysM-like domain-containing protein n=1 Tax=Photobacterium jeanii TaxID=858640 RepID=A0A178KPT9_9GAMM|nr:LysM-like peptidoglycan-binding domain-containing protein [Photobacterium jeanii]OAN19307.1 hypothetical protein A3K86_00255 [Photobacterium jeanii]PST86405.1 hypothetical protein C9I91_21490 [Photobacterium jeanii]
MGQARRRTKKKSEFKLPSLQFDATTMAQWKEKALSVRDWLRSYWMGMPTLHRRALTVLIPLFVVVLLLPSEPTLPDEQSGDGVRREVALDLGQETQSGVGERAEPLSPQRVKRPEPASPVHSTPTAVASESRSEPVTRQASSIEWQRYQIKQGQTLANIFREKSLPLADLYAVAAIEGKDKPLSRIKSGQWIRYKQNAAGDLDAIQIETTAGKSVMYYRLSDGSFSRGN